MMTRGRGVSTPPKSDDVIYEQPLIVTSFLETEIIELLDLPVVVSSPWDHLGRPLKNGAIILYSYNVYNIGALMYSLSFIFMYISRLQHNEVFKICTNKLNVSFKIRTLIFLTCINISHFFIFENIHSSINVKRCQPQILLPGKDSKRKGRAARHQISARSLNNCKLYFLKPQAATLPI